MMTEQEIKQQIQELQQKLKNVKKEENKNKSKERYFYKFYYHDEDSYEDYKYKTDEEQQEEYYKLLKREVTINTEVYLDTKDYWKSNKRTKQELIDYILKEENIEPSDEDSIFKKFGICNQNYMIKPLSHFEITGAELKKAKNGEIECIKLIL